MAEVEPAQARSSRTITQPIMNKETKEYEYTPMNAAPTKDQLIYQPIKLAKEMESKTNDDNTTITSLKKAKGFELIPPDLRFTSILEDLKYDQDKPSKCDFLIQVSMYNEGVKNFTDTLGGICENLNSFSKAGVEVLRIACVVIVDGTRAFHTTFSKQKGFFQQFFEEDPIKERFGVSDIRNCKLPDEKVEDEFAHCFMQKITLLDYSKHELQLIFCVKQKNKRKLNSHLWFFGGFCEFFQPKFVMLIDVGTQPHPNSLFLLYEALETQNDLAGCCGEIRPMDPNIWKLVVPAQAVEYKLGHIFDKAFESLLGYITFLPGAFSAYRWSALQGDPLWKEYFKSICRPEIMNAFNSNIYLAETRILCLALVSKKNERFLLRYVKNSVSETDVPESISMLMMQRRRWINGSWFALIDSIRKCAMIFESGHSCCRKMIFSIQMVYYVVNVVFAWVMVGSMFMVFSIIVKLAFGSIDANNAFSISTFIILIYFLLLLFVFILSLGVKPNRVEGLFKLIASVFGIYMFGAAIATLIFLLENSNQVILIYAVLGIIFIFSTIILLNCAVMTILKGICHYLFLTPTYINIFLIYSICNTHDCTWGSRPDLLTQEEKARLEEFEEFRTKWTIVWVLCNTSFAYFLQAMSNSLSGKLYIFCIGAIGASLLVFKFFGALFYLFQEACCKRKITKKWRQAQVAPIKKNNKEAYQDHIQTDMYVELEDKDCEVMKIAQIREEKDTRSQVRRSFENSEKVVSKKDGQQVASRVDLVLAEDYEESSEELSLVLREKRFKHGIKLTYMANETGIVAGRIKGIEEGRVIPTEQERKVLMDYIRKNCN